LKNDLAKLSPAETEVVRVVWDLGEARLRDVVAALPPDRGIDAATVQTYLRRLKAKGYLRTVRIGRVDLYMPAVRQNGVVRAVVKEFVDRLFSGDAVPLMLHLINENRLTEEQVEQLQARLDELKSRRGK
jgi:predicted transcriptional regulator